MNKKINNIAEKSIQDGEISRDEASFLMQINEIEIYDLFYGANRIRYNSFKDVVTTCSIVSAKQGSCSEDCKFCSQSSHYNVNIASYPIIENEEISRTIRKGERHNVDCVGLVTSGYSLNGEKDFDRICNYAHESSKNNSPPIHASIGTITKEMANKLVECGVNMINHNLETSERHFPNICTTHSYQDRIETIKNAKRAGMGICSGGIFGVGESVEDILDLAFELKNLEVDTIPLNFLNPIEGTPLYSDTPLKPMDILKIIAVYRFIFPNKDIKIAGGREKNLRDLQSWMFYAGANSTMIGNYLTTSGKSAEDDLQMISDLGLSLKPK